MSEQTPLLDHSGSKCLEAERADGDDTADNLARFRCAIGINIGSSSALTSDIESGRIKPAGLYAEVIHVRRMRLVQFHVVDTLYYIVVIAQILIGAVLATLGQLAKSHPTAITVLGVVNASIAGILALLKGQGLPDRLRKDEFQMRKVQDFIEAEDIRLALDPQAITQEELEKTVQGVFGAYNQARDTSEMNRPSSYAVQVENPATGKAGKGPADTGGAVRLRDDLGKGKTKFAVM